MINGGVQSAASGAVTLPENRVLEIRDVSVGFQQADGGGLANAVRNISFNVDRGATTVVVGESGSGKSVTSLAVMRLIEFGGGTITGGQIAFRRRSGDVVDLTRASEDTMRRVRGGEIGMIFQEPMTSLNPVLTVGEQITEAILLHQPTLAGTAQAEATRVLDRVRIPDAARVMKRYPHELSGGMRQRVMIAIALSCRPQLLIADEPTTALDVTVQAQILHLIRELQVELNMGVLLITHDMGVVAESADQVIVMRRGDLVEQNEVKPLFASPTHPYTRALLAAVPKLGAMRGTDLPARFELLRDPAAEPEKAVQADSAMTTVADRATVDAAVTAAIYSGDTSVSMDAALDKKKAVLSVRELITRFDVKAGMFGRVTKRVHAVERVSFDMFEGETLGLVGESGCGKTTTGRSLLRLVKPQSGSIYFDGVDLGRNDRQSEALLRRNVQLVFQDPFASLNPRIRIGDAIMEPMLIQGLATRDEAARRTADLLEKVGLDASMARRWPHQLSGGQRQRICIARALSTNPRVLVADESVSALDVSVQAQIVNLLIDLQKELGIACLFISHDMAVVERISHRVAVMYLGQIVEIGPRRAIFENPQHPYTKKLMDAVPIADPLRRRHGAPSLIELPSPVRAIGDEPVVAPLVQVGPGHFVARHAVGGAY
ncbi:dipeptide ABC transporter ATP-binding protein [Robbsia sp. KACC 23696]|uniref:dipeptide ABC transporter ATP-binding protein n=1 Tax=Robbsia sp. KACC 23696 TaxID=3149231 RepID=UPI00325BC94F